jgi:hypothetical protein
MATDYSKIKFASILEEWVYRALDDLKKHQYILDFRYQVSIPTPKNTVGGNVVDFVVYNPTATAVPVNGERWHTGSIGQDEWYKMIQLKNTFRTIVVLWGKELTDPEKTKKLCHEWFVLRAGQSKD